MIAKERVSHLLCLPSLYALLLEQATESQLGSLRTVIVAGEACLQEIPIHHYSRLSQVALFNEYGPTEGSVWSSVYQIQPKDSDTPVPIGKPVDNVQIYLLDAYLNPVPVAVPGELCIAGIGVGRGYLNRPDLTAGAFVPNPYGKPGERFYRSGDRARYRSDGIVEYLGRNDHQIKIRGFRIELGEIEACLNAYPAVLQAVVVAHELSPGLKRLVAYVVGQRQAVDIAALRAHVQATLPDYMAPTVFVSLDALPLTPNGKIDRQRLPAPDISSQLAHQYVAPRTPSEVILTDIWAKVLRIERVGVEDNFFELGGDSILSLQIVARANQAGLSLTPRQVFDHPRLADLAKKVGSTPAVRAEQGRVHGEVPLTPIQRWFFDQQHANPHHWNQAVLLEVREPLDPAILRIAVQKLVEHHDALRMRFSRQGGQWQQVNLNEEPRLPFHCEDLSELTPEHQAGAVTEAVERWQRSLNITTGPLLRVVWFDLGAHPARLLIVVHHLVVDGVSWRILLEDLYRACQQVAHDAIVALPNKTTSFRDWAYGLGDHARAGLMAEPYWDTLAGMPVPPLRVEHPEGANTEACTEEVGLSLTVSETLALLQEIPAVYRTRVNDILLAALAATIGRWNHSDSILIHLEGHGREELFANVDLSRTVGWFTSLFPVHLKLPTEEGPSALIKSIKEQLRAVPQQGVGYGLRRYLAAPGLSDSGAQVGFNYLGQLDQALPEGSPFVLAKESSGASFGHQNLRAHEWEILCSVLEDRLRIVWRYSCERYLRATIQGLCEHYQSTLRDLIAHCLTPEAGDCTPSDFPLANLTQAEIDKFIDDPRNIEDIYPLASMQEGLLFHTLLNPDSGIYLMQDRYEIQGDLDVVSFHKAWQQIVDTHTVLRTAFVWDNTTKPHQIVYKKAALPIEVLDWRGLSKSDEDRRLRALLQDELNRGLPLERAPILRIRLIRLAEDRWIFVRSHHHLLLDAWCLSLLLVDFLAYYEALTKGKALPNRSSTPYREYIAWLQRQDLEAAERYWRDYLRGFTNPTYLAANRAPIALSPGESQVADEIVYLSRADTDALYTLAKRHKLTPNTYLQAAWAMLVSYYTDRAEVVFGVTVAGRPAEIPGVEQIVGLFINTLPLRVQIEPNARLLDWLNSLLVLNLQMRQFEYAPLADIQHWSENERGQALFDNFVVFENVPVDPTLKGERLALDILGYETRTHSNYPLNLVIIPKEALHLQLTYDRRVFDRTTVVRMLGHYRTLLEAMIHTPEVRLSDLPILGEAKRRCLLYDWNRTERRYPEPQDIVARFEAQVERTPAACAIVCGEAQLSYRALNTRVNHLAHALRGYGIGPDVIVALLGDRGVDFLVMMLGIFKAGGAYLPMDPAHPDGRLKQVLVESQTAFILTEEGYLDRARQVCAAVATPSRLLCLTELEAPSDMEHNPFPRHSPQNLAFIIYTSGSTGKPKGAMVEYRGMFNNLITKVSALGLTEQDVIAQTASQCFDISVWQHLTALTCGARVEVFPNEISRDPARLLGQLTARGVTILEMVSSMIRALLEIAEAGTQLPVLRWLMPCGEAFPPELCRRWMQRFPHLNLLNAYGPAECSDDVSYHLIEPPGEGDLTVPIGRPVHNTQLYLLNRWLEPVPVGVPGEICVGGVQVGRGYLNRADLTAAAFIPDPFGEAGGRLYRTGDLGRYRDDGVLEFLGRIDHQVKIRGHRIEPGEIEACLVTHPEVREACVVSREVSEGVYRLVGYVVGPVREVGALRAHILNTLPDYMVPAAFVFLEALPLSPNGKVDRKRLPDPDIEAQLAHQYVAPRNATEETLANIWAEVLRLERVGVHDNFFELGGDSLLLVRLLTKVSETFSVELPFRSLFDAATVAAQAAFIEGRQGQDLASAPLDLEAEAQLESGLRPLFVLSWAESRTGAVMLTGAAGFLGTYLLAELLAQTDGRIYCLVRAEDERRAYDKLQLGLERQGLWQAAWVHRIVPICGELAAPHLGLTELTYAALARELGAIYHNAAQVNDVQPYWSLKPINVNGTREMIRLACAERPKALHYVSTVSVFGAHRAADGRAFEEKDFPGWPQWPDDGYGQSKWVAERMVRIVGARGLPVTVYRPAFIIGASHNGVWNTGDFLNRILHGCVALGLTPDREEWLDLAPVDYVARSLVHLSLHPAASGGTYHLLNACKVSSSLSENPLTMSESELGSRLTLCREHLRVLIMKRSST